MAASTLNNIIITKKPFQFNSSNHHIAVPKHSPNPVSIIRCSSATSSTSNKSYNITLLPGDGIGPEVISVARNILNLAASIEGIEFKFNEKLMGGAALDSTGVPLPEETLEAAKQSDAVLLGAIGGYKWDNNEKHLKPETGLLQLREGLKVFANLRPATVLPQFDTIVTNNIFGDILSDEASMITGSIGMLPSASLSESGPGLFEPIHGSAPDTAGQDKANPLATILSAAMLLKYGLGEVKAAERIELAVLDTLNRGFRTGDIYSAGNKLVGCKEMGEEVLKSVDTKTPASV